MVGYGAGWYQGVVPGCGTRPVIEASEVPVSGTSEVPVSGTSEVPVRLPVRLPEGE